MYPRSFCCIVPDCSQRSPPARPLQPNSGRVSQLHDSPGDVAASCSRAVELDSIFDTKEPHREVIRQHAFRDLSTRRHYAGPHEIAVIINGVEKARVGFALGH